MKRNARGFTLMELMVVIVIVAILAAVAVPLYINYVKDAQRTEAKGAIGAIVTAEQTFYQSAVQKGLAPTYSADTSKVRVDLSDVAHNWDFAISAASAAGFTVTATGKSQSTAGLEVKCVYARGADPDWSEK